MVDFLFALIELFSLSIPVSKLFLRQLLCYDFRSKSKMDLVWGTEARALNFQQYFSAHFGVVC